jgi:transposase InsO family protein
VYIYRGEIYLEKSHVQLLREEPRYVKERYHAVVTALSPIGRIKRQKAAQSIGVSKRQFQRIIKRFQEEGILGLRYRSRKPRNSPNKTPTWLEDIIVKVREETGFGPHHISSIINISLENQGRTEQINQRTITRVLTRRGIIESERRARKEWKRFEWGHPNRLIQADLTPFNGIPILTMEDDHSRKGWAIRLTNRKDKTVVRGMKKLLKIRYDNLLTDNGSQFSRKNRVMREYCDKHINEKHIWTSLHHPQTLGKLSAFQKGLKRFLFHKLGNSRDIHHIDYYIDVYVHWYNNGKYHSAIDTYPEMRYSGQQDMEWYNRLVKSLKLEDILAIRPEG